MEVEDIVGKLIGEINPVGATHTDNERLVNLKVMTALVDELLCRIAYVATNANEPEFSKQQAGLFAKNFLEFVTCEYKD